MEYSISTSLIVLIICLVFGIVDLISLTMLLGINMGVMWFGDLFETMNRDTKPEKLIWTPFYNASYGAAYIWFIIIWYISKSTEVVNKAPGTAWYLLGSYMLLCLGSVFIIYSQFMAKIFFKMIPLPGLRYAVGESLMIRLVMFGRTLFVFRVLVFCATQTVYPW